MAVRTCRWLLLLGAIVGIWWVLATKGGQRWIKRLTQHGPQFTKEYVSAPIATAEPNQVGTELWKGRETYGFKVTEGAWLEQVSTSITHQLWNNAGAPAMRKLHSDALAYLEAYSAKLGHHTPPTTEEASLLQIRQEIETRPRAFQKRVEVAAVKAISAGIAGKLREILATTEICMDVEVAADVQDSKILNVRAQFLGADAITTNELEIPVEVELDYWGSSQIKDSAPPKELNRFSNLTFEIGFRIEPRMDILDFHTLETWDEKLFDTGGQAAVILVSDWPPKAYISNRLPMSADWLEDKKISGCQGHATVDCATGGLSGTFARKMGNLAVSISRVIAPTSGAASVR